MPMKPRWHIFDPDRGVVEKIGKTLNCNLVTATILANRNITSEDDLICFANPSLNRIRPPFSIKDMDRAIGRIHDALTRNENILIFGDYDVDGITATVIVMEFLRLAGGTVTSYIPHRIKEGYGLQTEHIEKFAKPKGIDLIITVDCGSGSHDAVEAANRAGIDIIITDHHKISEHRPHAVAVVNPKRNDCTAGFDHLAGVGVAYCLLICLRKHLRDLHFWDHRVEPNLKQMCDLVALGTIADMVPLLHENRIFSKAGLRILGSADRSGIKALTEICGIENRVMDADDVAFRLAPRINAPGRIDHIEPALELLTSRNMETARRFARSLNTMNMKRQDIEKQMLSEAFFYLEKNPHLLQSSALVISFVGWHEGVLGIVASKLVEAYFRPVVLISIKDNVGKGSARSIPGFDIYKGLAACSTKLERFGGHSMAAGLRVKIENIEAFERHFENVVRDMTRPDDFIPMLSIDMELGLDDISRSLLDELESLKPFGAGNSEPIFMSRNIKVISSTIVGGGHRRMMLKQTSDPNAKAFSAIQFNADTRVPMPFFFDRMAFRVRWNHWKGTKTPQIIVEDIDAG